MSVEFLSLHYVSVGFPFVLQWVRGVAETFAEKVREQPLCAVIGLLYALIKSLYIIPLSIFEGLRNTLKRKSPGPVAFYRPVYYAGAYVVTLHGAQKLQSLTRPIVYTADQLPNRARVRRSLRFRVYAPLSVRQLKKRFGSSILGLEGSQL